MKKLLTTLFIVTFALGLHSTVLGQVQEGDFKIGAGLSFGSGVGFGGLDNDLGIRVDAYHAFTDEIRGGGDFTFYLPKSEGGVDITVWELNLNGNYVFYNEAELIGYALAGINITGLNLSGDNGFDSSDTEIGLNLGAGLEYGLDFADLFAEAKLGNLGGNADQFVLSAGLRFPIN